MGAKTKCRAVHGLGFVCGRDRGHLGEHYSLPPWAFVSAEPARGVDAAPAPPVGDEAKHEESIFKFIHGLGLRGKEATLACDLVEARDRKLYAAGREQGARDERMRSYDAICDIKCEAHGGDDGCPCLAMAEQAIAARGKGK